MMILRIFILAVVATAAVADVPVIHNPREAPIERTVSYREVWRAGADDDADFIFGVIGDAETDADGNIYLLDTQQFIVFKFSPTGEYLGTVSRQGEGPGEINLCFGMTRWDDGHLALDKAAPSSLVIVANDGTPHDLLRFEFEPRSENQRFAFSTNLEIRDGFLVSGGRASRLENALRYETHFTVALDRELREIHNFGDHESGIVFADEINVDEEREFSPVALWALGRDGEVYFAPRRNEWIIEVRQTTGELVRTIRRDYEPHRRTKKEKEKAKSGWTFSSDENLPPIHYHMADTDPAVGRMAFVGDELRVWRSWRKDKLAEGTATRFDVFDRAGHLVEDRSLALPYNPEEDGLHHLEDGRLVRVKSFRSAQAASSVGWNVQRGDDKQDGSDSEDIILEVIVYEPEDM